MDIFTRRTAAARHAAIERHRSLTSTIAAAGGMATIGFAALAAATFRGNTATTAASTETREAIIQPEAGDDDETFVDPGTTTPRFNAPNVSVPSRGDGPGQATTGGS
jgi:hypothetical protein